MFSFDSNMFYNYCLLEIIIFGIKTMGCVSILHVFCLDVTFARFSSVSGKLTISHIIAH